MGRWGRGRRATTKLHKTRLQDHERSVGATPRMISHVRRPGVQPFSDTRIIGSLALGAVESTVCANTKRYLYSEPPTPFIAEGKGRALPDSPLLSPSILNATTTQRGRPCHMRSGLRGFYAAPNPCPGEGGPPSASVENAYAATMATSMAASVERELRDLPGNRVRRSALEKASGDEQPRSSVCS